MATRVLLTIDTEAPGAFQDTPRDSVGRAAGVSSMPLTPGSG